MPLADDIAGHDPAQDRDLDKFFLAEERDVFQKGNCP
jgi:hypothetical protein